MVWTNDWAYARAIPTGDAWRGCFAVPRELNLRATAAGFVLAQQPLTELRTLCKKAVSLKNQTLKAGAPGYELSLWGEA